MMPQDNTANATRITGRPVVLALVLILVGVALAYGGALLLMAGGSVYYLLAGLAALVAGVLLWRRHRVGAYVAGALVLGTTAWAFWESGADFWALVPRLWLFLLLGAWLILPFTLRKIGMATRPGKVWLGALAGTFGAGLLGLGLHHATGMELPDPALDRGMAQVAAAQIHTEATSWGGDWRSWGNDKGGSRFSPLDQITPANVGKLKVAWTYRAGYGDDGVRGNMEMTPLKIGNRLYMCTPYNDIIALDAVSGKEAWRYHSQVDRKGFVYSNCRGVTYYEVPEATGVCAKRIFSTTFSGDLFALDAVTGKLCPEFGTDGKVALRKGLGDHDHPGYYFVTSAPALVRGNLVMGGWVADGQYWGEPSGVIRAFDAVTGKLSWAWDMGRPDLKGEPPEGETYTPSTPNSWAPMSVDEEMGLVFAPTGNTSGSDYYGGQRRPFDDKYASGLVALDAETGDVRWSFQTTHHDLWDYDVASQPSLVEVPTEQGMRKAVIQPTKRAQLFVLDRATGEPIKLVKELKAPQGGIAPGERLSPTQPYSIEMPDLGGPRLKERMMWGISPFDQLWCRITFRQSRYEGDFTPPGLGIYSIIYPGYGGGHNWPSVSFDLDRGLLITNTNRVANRVRIAERAEADAAGVQPLALDNESNIGGFVGQQETPYGADVGPLLSPLSAPCQQPPYGMLSAIDLKTGKLVWHQPIGNARAAGPLGMRSNIPLAMGMPMFGGSVVTRGGLIFISATKDETMRAFETATGKLLWEDRLPAGGQAVPMTYMGEDGRQYVVITAAGHYGTASKRGDYIVAYALPDKN